MVVYNPDDIEWLALILGFVAALVPWGLTVAIASGFQWRAWWLNKKVAKPFTMIHPMTFSFLLFCAEVLAAVGWWLSWREGHRSVLIYYTPPDPFSGNIPSNPMMFATNILFLLYAIFALGVGGAFFTCCLQYGWALGAILLAFVLFGLSVAQTVISFIIWFAPGILFIFVSLFWLYALGLSIHYYIDYKNGILVAPFESLQEQLYRESRGTALPPPVSPIALSPTTYYRQ